MLAAEVAPLSCKMYWLSSSENLLLNPTLGRLRKRESDTVSHNLLHTIMSRLTLDEDSIDEVLYLARANEASELESYLSDLSAQTKHSKADVVSAAIDPNSKNSALHYAAANGHNGTVIHQNF